MFINFVARCQFLEIVYPISDIMEIIHYSPFLAIFLIILTDTNKHYLYFLIRIINKILTVTYY